MSRIIAASITDRGTPEVSRTTIRRYELSGRAAAHPNDPTSALSAGSSAPSPMPRIETSAWIGKSGAPSQSQWFELAGSYECISDVAFWAVVPLARRNRTRRFLESATGQIADRRVCAPGCDRCVTLDVPCKIGRRQLPHARRVTRPGRDAGRRAVSVCRPSHPRSREG